MIISNFKNSNNFNTFYNNFLPNLPGAKRLNLNLYLLWSFKEIKVIKSYIEEENIDFASILEALQNSNPDLYKDSSEIYNSCYSNTEVYIYPYTSVKLSNALTTLFLPSLKNKVFSFICSQLTRGDVPIADKYLSNSPDTFKACMLFPYKITDIELASFHAAVFEDNLLDVNDPIDVLKQVSIKFTELKKDLKIYTTYIQELEETVIFLNDQLDAELKQGLNGYLLNWH